MLECWVYTELGRVPDFEHGDSARSAYCRVGLASWDSSSLWGSKGWRRPRAGLMLRAAQQRMWREPVVMTEQMVSGG